MILKIYLKTCIPFSDILTINKDAIKLDIIRTEIISAVD